jgi:DNA mismatch endonuclease (patch repair protein)
MRAVKSKDTAPEMKVRRYVHSLGYRFRLHCKDLPGKPDLVLPRLTSAIFGHGCFWHGHDCPRGARLPKENAEYWSRKIGRNATRDKSNLHLLGSMGWKVLVVWECELTTRAEGNERKIARFLSSAAPSNATPARGTERGNGALKSQKVRTAASMLGFAVK